jgi:hypothetical protein
MRWARHVVWMGKREILFLWKNLKTHGGPRCGQDDIKMDLKETGCQCLAWILLAQGRGRKWQVKNKILNL